MKVFDKVYDGKSIDDLRLDISEAFAETQNIYQTLPKDEHGFISGKFLVSVVWVSDEHPIAPPNRIVKEWH